MSSAPSNVATPPAVDASTGGRALAGFLLSGFLLALLGALLPAWGYQRDPPEFTIVAIYFLSLAVGLVGGAGCARHLMRRRGLSFLLVFSCSLSCAALLYLAVATPQVAPWGRVAGLLILGVGAGILNTGLLHAISASYQADAAGTVSRGGVWYGLGCLVATLLVAGTYYAYSVPVVLVFMAVVPAVFAVIYAKCRCTASPESANRGIRQGFRDFRSPGAVLLALLLFFQFGNEWSLAGWLPLFLIRRVGLSPKGALFTLALFWLFLVTGRLGAVAILPRVRHGRLLLGSVASALFGCLILLSTNKGFGAASGVFFVAAGYAVVFPLVLGTIGNRFPHYHPGFFSGIFSLAQLGGLLAPASLGFAAAGMDMEVGVVVAIPLLGTCMVAALLMLLWLESKVTGR